MGPPREEAPSSPRPRRAPSASASNEPSLGATGAREGSHPSRRPSSGPPRSIPRTTSGGGPSPRGPPSRRRGPLGPRASLGTSRGPSELRSRACSPCSASSLEFRGSLLFELLQLRFDAPELRTRLVAQRFIVRLCVGRLQAHAPLGVFDGPP